MKLGGKVGDKNDSLLNNLLFFGERGDYEIWKKKSYLLTDAMYVYKKLALTTLYVLLFLLYPSGRLSGLSNSVRK